MSVEGGQVSLMPDVPGEGVTGLALRLLGATGGWASTAVVTAKSPLMVPMVSVAVVVVPGVGAEVTRAVTLSLGEMVPADEV